MNLDSKARERIVATLCDSDGGRKAYRAIGLPDGERLLLAAQGGAVIYALLDAAGDFGPNQLRDVTLQVLAALRGES